MMKTYLGIVALVLAGVCGCGSAGGEAATCEPAGTWSVTASPAAGNDCADGEMVATDTRVVTVANGTATITDTSTGAMHAAPLDGSCHMAYVTAVSTSDFVAAGSTDWTFNGTSLSGAVNANVTATDGTKCTLKQTLTGVRQ